MNYCEFDIDITFEKGKKIYEDSSRIYLDLDLIQAWFKVPGGTKVETVHGIVYVLNVDYDAFSAFMRLKFQERFIN